MINFRKKHSEDVKLIIVAPPPKVSLRLPRGMAGASRSRDGGTDRERQQLSERLRGNNDRVTERPQYTPLTTAADYQEDSNRHRVVSKVKTSSRSLAKGDLIIPLQSKLPRLELVYQA